MNWLNKFAASENRSPVRKKTHCQSILSACQLNFPSLPSDYCGHSCCANAITIFIYTYTHIKIFTQNRNFTKYNTITLGLRVVSQGTTYNPSLSVQHFNYYHFIKNKLFFSLSSSSITSSTSSLLTSLMSSLCLIRPCMFFLL